MDENVVLETKQYVVVIIGNEQYGIDIQYVDNIVRMQKITRVPKAQHHFRGVINLRGEVIPVMSVRDKFGLPQDDYSNDTRIIILKLDAHSKVGLLVDQVKEVIQLSEAEIDKISNAEDTERARFLNGVGKIQGSLVSLLNITEVVSDY